jgi:hypothetical protein
MKFELEFDRHNPGFAALKVTDDTEEIDIRRVETRFNVESHGDNAARLAFVVIFPANLQEELDCILEAFNHVSE